MLIGTYTVNELHKGSGRFAIGESPSAVERYTAPWANAGEIAMTLLGYPAGVQGMPLQHPFLANWYCTEAECEPLGKPTGELNWLEAIITAKYMPAIPTPTGNQLILDESLNYSGQIQSVPPGTFKWSSQPSSAPAGKMPSHDITITVPTGNYGVTVSRYLSPPTSVIYGLIGKSNSTTFRGADPGTMVFLGAASKRRIITYSNVSNTEWTITYKFIQSNVMQMEFCKLTGAFQQVVTQNGGYYKFLQADFTTLGIGS